MDDRQLYDACVTGDVKMFLALAKQDHNLLLTKFLPSCGTTALHIAARFGHVELVKEILKLRQDLANVQDNNLDTPLHLAVKYGKFECLKCLTDFPNVRDLVNMPDNNGSSVLHLAIIGRRYDMASYIVRRGDVDVNVVNKSGLTALDLLSCNSSDDNNNNNNNNNGKEQLVTTLRDAGGKKLGKYYYDSLCNSRNTMVVVATLIVSVTFSAMINPPGGVEQDDPFKEGRAVAGRRPSFKCFLIFDYLAFIWSVLVVIMLTYSVASDVKEI